MVLDTISGQMVASMKVNGDRIKVMERVSISVWMVVNIRDNGCRERCMVEDITFGPMGSNIRANTK